MKQSRIWLLLTFVVLGCGAPNESTPTPTKSAQKELTNFAFLKANNPRLTRDYLVPFKSGYALATLPTGTDIRTLKPSFATSPGAIATVGGLRQESEVTAPGFSSPVNYLVTAEDGSQQTYTVEISVQQNLAVVDTDVQAFMTRYNLPGLSLAITKGERLVYAKGYGFADKEQQQAVTPQSLFRIASLSKSITAITVLKLVEEGRLRLDQTVFGPQGVLGTIYGNQPYRAGIEQVTIQHLLQHTAGGNWPNVGNDPLYVDMYNMPYPISTSLSSIIDNTLNQLPLVSIPGSKYSYTNFGYCLLGRIIEKVTGQTYEAAVKQILLTKANVNGMQIGSDLPNEKAIDEVQYYEAYPGRYGFKPYMYPARRYDAAGGWLASASQLAQILVRADGYPGKEDILASTTLKDMLTPTPQSNYTYGMGWQVSATHSNYWHTGNLQGTSTIWVRYSNGYNVVILTNTYPSDDATYWNSVYQLTNDIVTKGNALFMTGDQFPD
ncbi:serine hydrolase domain-containing protein [Spirosoma pulveris]